MMHLSTNIESLVQNAIDNSTETYTKFREHYTREKFLKYFKSFILHLHRGAGHSTAALRLVQHNPNSLLLVYSEYERLHIAKHYSGVMVENVNRMLGPYYHGKDLGNIKLLVIDDVTRMLENKIPLEQVTALNFHEDCFFVFLN